MRRLSFVADNKKARLDDRAFLVCMLLLLEEDAGNDVGHNGADSHADESRNHERMVEHVFTDLCGTCAVNVHGGDIRRIVRDEEVSINARQGAEQDPSWNTQFVGHGQKSHHNGCLGVDEH